MTAISRVASRGSTGEAVSAPLSTADSGIAIVLSRTGRDALIGHGGSEIAARVAFGCLVQPEPGDRVLTSFAGGEAWIVSILDRHSGVPARLFAEGDISIVSARGGISLLAAEDVNIDAGIRARISAKEIDLHAGVGRFVLDEMMQIGRRANLYVAKIRSVGEMVETFAEHVLMRAKRSTRFVEESDQLRAGNVDHRAEATMQLQAKTTFMSAETVVRIDAEQIHMG